MGFRTTLRIWLTTQPIQNNQESAHRLTLLKQGLQHVPLVNQLHRCYNENRLLKPLLKSQLDMFIQSVRDGDVQTPSNEMVQVQAYFCHVMKGLQHNCSCSDVRIRQWSEIASFLYSNGLIDLVKEHSVCFDNPQTLAFIRFCLDYTVSECLRAHIIIKPIRF